jgi:hypothetical protein
MKRTVIQLLVAAGLAAGACGVAQAHTDFNVGLSVGAPARTYVAPAAVYAPRPTYYSHSRWDHRDYRQHGWDRGDRRWGGDHRGWDHGGNGWRD